MNGLDHSEEHLELEVRFRNANSSLDRACSSKLNTQGARALPGGKMPPKLASGSFLTAYIVQ